jgi:3-oxoadipate enol-lactonase
MAALHHRLAGSLSASGPVLLLIHPLGAASDFWDACLPLLKAQLPCLVVDLRSAGASPRAAQPPGLDQHVEDLETLRAELRVAHVIPVGCAMGSMVAAAYAARHPERVPALVMCNPAPRTGDASRIMLQARANAVRIGGMAAILPDAVDRPFAAQPRDERHARYLTVFAAQDAASYADAALGFATADATADLRRIRCPALLIAGRNDLLLPPALAEEVLHLLPTDTARLEVDEEAAHFVPYQQPSRFAARVLGFLAPFIGQDGAGER